MSYESKSNVLVYIDFFQGGDVKVGDYDHRTPLHIATCEGHLDMVDFLIRHGAFIHSRDR